jgi:hypothetical protein
MNEDSRIHDHYEDFSQLVKSRFNMVVSGNHPLFVTNAENLFDVYLNNIPEEGRQHYNCHACRHFINRFGGLAMITENGEMASALWNENDGIPSFFKNSVKAMKDVVNKAKVKGVFVSKESVLGQPTMGGWDHLAVSLPSRMVFKSRLLSANQAMAEKVEEFKMLIGGLVEYSPETVEKAVALLKTNTMYRSDKCLGVAEWLQNLHSKRSSVKSNAKDNVVWLAVATAPTGYCHVKSSMIGTLLDDISSGLSSDSVARRFAEKMNPANYMRAQVAPSENNIQQAEKIVEKLGIANSLKRRYAKFEEIPQFIWRSNSSYKKEANQSGGVFANVTPKGKSTTSSDKFDLPSATMTWDKFQKTVLPDADSIEVKVDNPNRFMALVTASDETAENILQWDNTFSWYYHGGIDAEIKRRVEEAGGQYENNEIRCSLIWEGYTDLDLHCITPTGEHIYFGDKRDGRGGWLDVDANGGYATTLHPVENIRWSSNARNGHYQFYVHNYCERGTGYNPYKVELEINGKIYTFSDVAGHTYRKDVFNFDYIKGQQPNITGNSYFSNEAWNVNANEFVKVNGITRSPNLWGKEQSTHAGTHVFFILDKCKDDSEGKGRGFFTETLKSELREVRKTLEAYLANTPIENADEATACGVGYSKDNEWNVILKVTSGNSARLIKIDRWD